MPFLPPRWPFGKSRCFSTTYAMLWARVYSSALLRVLSSDIGLYACISCSSPPTRRSFCCLPLMLLVRPVNVGSSLRSLVPLSLFSMAWKRSALLRAKMSPSSGVKTQNPYEPRTCCEADLELSLRRGAARLISQGSRRYSCYFCSPLSSCWVVQVAVDGLFMFLDRLADRATWGWTGGGPGV